MSIAGQFECDVAIVGASISGCAAAALFARRGLRVVLIEQRRDSAAYKRMCTHYILPCARPTLQRLGLDARIEHKGGVRNSLAIWTRWGLIPAVDVAKKNFGYNVRRVTLDPLLRSLATETPGVEYWPGFARRDFAGGRGAWLVWKQRPLKASGVWFPRG